MKQCSVCGEQKPLIEFHKTVAACKLCKKLQDKGRIRGSSAVKGWTRTNIIPNGERFGRLIVLGFSHVNKDGRSLFYCLCDCNKRIVTLGNSLRHGASRSCGCIRVEKTQKHGWSKTNPYYVWRGMIKRCENPNDKNFPSYGGRGIRVCAKWRNDFMAFYTDMGDRPFPNASLERTNNNGHYEPGNVVWATPKQQMRNTRNTRFLTFNGLTKCVSDWADAIGIGSHLIHSRLKNGWSVEKALAAPSQRKAIL